jgi:hypothetical protein
MDRKWILFLDVKYDMSEKSECIYGDQCQVHLIKKALKNLRIFSYLLSYCDMTYESRNNEVRIDVHY